VTVETTHLRSDAQRNLERILEAARAVFADRGLDASVGEVAARAGVGTATIFRRFPTKDDLLAAVLESELNGLLAQAEKAATLSELMTAMLGRFISARCICEAVGSELFERPDVAALKTRLGAALADVLEREQRAGTIRTDVTLEDVEFLFNALGQAGMQAEKTAPGTWRRYVDIVLAGLRP
jgi:AcrR family transcriptional regulator